MTDSAGSEILDAATVAKPDQFGFAHPASRTPREIGFEKDSRLKISVISFVERPRTRASTRSLLRQKISSLREFVE